MNFTEFATLYPLSASMVMVVIVTSLVLLAGSFDSNYFRFRHMPGRD